ncbi:DMT family transporter [Muricoccus radiodurans]|uniref:DMT family transporter n=1 Tax=Muricoccus radiodurans TaxID=2231721 RepID=UPI003CECC743
MSPSPTTGGGAQRERRIGFLCAFAVLFIWAGFLLSGRLAAKQSFTPWDVVALRYAGAFVTVLPLVAIHGLPRPGIWRAAGLVVPAAFVFPLLAYVAFGFAPASHAGVMLPGMLPFLTAALGAAFLGERWTRRRVLSLAVVACGVGLLAADTFGGHPGAWRGDLLFLAGALGWSVYTLLVRLWRITALEATILIGIWAAPVFLPLWWLALPSNLAAIPWPVALGQMVWQGAFAVVLAGFLFTRAVTALGAATTTSITAVVPAMAALAAWPLLDEPLGWAGLAGIALVSAGMVLGVVRPAAP